MVHSLIHADLLSPRIEILLYVVMPMLVIRVALGIVVGARVDRAAVTAGTAALIIAILGVVVTATVLDSNTPWRSPVLTDIQEVAVMPYAMMVKIKQEDFANGKNSN